MPDQLQTFKVSCRGGLDTNRDVLAQATNAPGSAIRLINYEPALVGGYRRINGFTHNYGTLTGTGNVLGLVVMDGIGIVGARRPSSGGNFLYKWNDSTSSWDTLNTVNRSISASCKKVRFTKYRWTGPTIVGCDGEDFAFKYHINSSGTASYAEISTSPAPAKPKFAAAFKNRLFLAGNDGEESLLYYSASNDDEDFTTASGGGSINVGFEINAIKPFRDALYIFGRTNIKKLTGNSTSNFVVEPVTDDIGCVAGDSVVEVAGDLLFLGPDGIRPIAGTDKIGDVQLETISKRIQNLIKDYIDDFDLENFTSVVIRGKSQFRYFFDEDAESGILGGLREQPQGGIGMEFSTLFGLPVTAADSGYIGKTETVVHGDADGKVYDHDLGNTQNGTEIVSVFQTPFIDFGDTETRKNLHVVSVFLDTTAAANISFSLLYDYEDTNTFNPANFEISDPGTAATFNESLFDGTAEFDGTPSPVIRKYVSGSGRSVSLRFVTNADQASHAIQGFVLTFGVGDKR